MPCPTPAAAVWISASWDDGAVDAIDRYRTASEANDIDAVMATLAPDAEAVSSISGRHPGIVRRALRRH